MSVAKTIQMATAVPLRVMNSIFPNEGTRTFLLKRNENSGSYTTVSELTGALFCRYGRTRDELELLISNSDADFRDTFAQATHIGYGVPDDDGEIYVYEIQQDGRDGTPADGQSPFWKALAFRVPRERFTVS